MASSWFLVDVPGAKIYVTANPLRSDTGERTKDNIAKERQLYLDFDIDGEVRLTSLRTSDTVPTPTPVFSTSLCRYQVLCTLQISGPLPHGHFHFRAAGKHPQTACDSLWRRARQHGLQPGPSLAGIPELQARSVVSHPRQVPLRFDLESR
jgi:hypothetical protein